MNVKSTVRGALIGALYTLLTVAVQPISSGLVQLRISEALTVTPYFTFAAVPGLFIGCALSNLIVGGALYDVVFGSLATLVAAAATWLCGKYRLSKWLAPLPPVIVNAFVIGALQYFVYGLKDVGYLTCVLYIGAEQAVACYALGMPLMLLLSKYAPVIFKE